MQIELEITLVTFLEILRSFLLKVHRHIQKVTSPRFYKQRRVTERKIMNLAYH